LDEFLREGELMAALDHPNVIPLLGICYSMDGVPSLVLPFMQLGDLRSYVSDPYRVSQFWCCPTNRLISASLCN
jgi:serine/threonine protein kinase